MDDVFRNETEAMLYLNKVIYESGIVDPSKIFFPNTRKMELNKDDEWLLVNYSLTTGNRCQIRGRVQRSRCDLRMNITYFSPLDKAVGRIYEVYNKLSDIFKYGWQYKSLYFTTERNLLIDVKGVREEFTSTHTSTIISFKFMLDTEDAKT